MKCIIMFIKESSSMKIMVALTASTILVACATPRYTYYFSTYATQNTSMAKKIAATDSITDTEKVLSNHFLYANQLETFASGTLETSNLMVSNDASLDNRSNDTKVPTAITIGKKETMRKLQAIKKIKNTETSNPQEGDKKKNKFAVIGFILSLFSWFIFLAPFAILFCVIGMKSEKRKLAKVGLILAIIGVIIFALLLIFASL